MDNALFYTLSTIAQTLAAAFGILAVFYVFRIQTIDRERGEVVGQMLDIVAKNQSAGGRAYLQNGLLSHDQQEVKKAIAQFKGLANGNGLRLELIEVNGKRIAAFDERLKHLRIWFWLAGVVNLFTIALSIGLIPKVPCLVGHSYSWCAVAVVVILVYLSFLLDALLVYVAQKRLPKSVVTSVRDVNAQ